MGVGLTYPPASSGLRRPSSCRLGTDSNCPWQSYWKLANRNREMKFTWHQYGRVLCRTTAMKIALRVRLLPNFIMRRAFQVAGGVARGPMPVELARPLPGSHNTVHNRRACRNKACRRWGPVGGLSDIVVVRNAPPQLAGCAVHCNEPLALAVTARAVLRRPCAVVGRPTHLMH
jgi:YD repeat-containing protein